MKKASGLRHFRAVFVGLVALVALPSVADAQAWVEGKGALSAGANFTSAFSDDVVDPDGNTYDGEDLSIANHTLTLGLEYVPLAKLGLTLDLPFLAVKYAGEQDGNFPPHGDYDDGDFHYTPTDARLGVRYQLLDGLRAISPHIAVSVPMADYAITGFAGAGRGIIKGHVGLSAGAVMDPWVPNLYVHGSAEYTNGTKPTVDDPMFEKDALDDYGQGALDFNFSIGYFIGTKLTASALVGAHFQQDGVTFNDVPFGPDADQNVLFKYHDAVLDEDYIHPGLELSYAVTDALTLSGNFRMFVSGANTRNIMGGGLGLNYQILAPKIVDLAEDWDEEAWDEDVETDIEADAEVDAEVGAEVDL